MNKNYTITTPFCGGNAKQRRKERRSGVNRKTWTWVARKGKLR